MQPIAKAIADSPRFQNTITLLIIVAGVPVYFLLRHRPEAAVSGTV